MVSQAPSRARGRRRYSQWHCLCDCGNEAIADASKMKTGTKKSCGCLQATGIAARTLAHGQARRGAATPVYRLWNGIKKRCFDASHNSFHRYGGRGIGMHEAWRASFETFAAAVGERPSAAHSLDRIDNDGNYEPGNVRWATAAEQANNTSVNVRYEFGGEHLTLPQVAAKVGLPESTIENRLKVGRSLQEATTKGRLPPRRPC